jgi:hypothetical protein
MAYPKSEDKKIQKLSNILIKYADQQGVEFSFGGNTLYPVEALSFFGGLSLFLVEAKENYEKVYNNLYTVGELMDGLGKKIKEPTPDQVKKEEEFFNKQQKTKIFPIELYQKEEETFFGFEPKVSMDIPADFLMIAHFSHYTLEEYLKIYKKNKMLLIDGKIPLDPLYDKMVTKFNQNKLRIIPVSSLPKASSEN